MHRPAIGTLRETEFSARAKAFAEEIARTCGRLALVAVGPGASHLAVGSRRGAAEILVSAGSDARGEIAADRHG